MVLDGPKVREARKVFRKVKTASPKVVFALTNQKRVQAAIKNLHKGRGKDQKRKGKEGAFPQSGLSASETPSEEGYGHAWTSCLSRQHWCF